MFFFSVKRHNLINQNRISVAKQLEPNDIKTMRERGKDLPSLNMQRKKEARSD